MVFKFVNNKGHARSTVQHPNFRKMIDYAIKHAKDLQGYKHMGERKYISIQCASFEELVKFVSGLVKECRQWYIQNTVRTLLHYFE